MKSFKLRPRIFAGIAAAIGLAVSSGASASLVLTLDDLATVGVDVIVVDGTDGGVGTGTAKGTSTVADSDPTDGIVLYVGGAGGFSVTVNTGTSKPILSREIDLFSLAISGGAGTLEIMLTDTGFTDILAGTLLHSIGGTTDGTVTVIGAGADNGDAEFAMTTLVPIIGPFGPGAFSGTSTAAFNADGSYSMSQTIRITHTAAGQATTFDSSLQLAAPEPATLGLLGLGLAGIGAASRRRKRA